MGATAVARRVSMVAKGKVGNGDGDGSVEVGQLCFQQLSIVARTVRPAMSLINCMS